jgi:N-acetylglucosaminyldiphosphoundecaprenol N-acetyl-beta-D-mannosaminyltransferase
MLLCSLSDMVRRHRGMSTALGGVVMTGHVSLSLPALVAQPAGRELLAPSTTSPSAPAPAVIGTDTGAGRPSGATGNLRQLRPHMPPGSWLPRAQVLGIPLTVVTEPGLLGALDAAIATSSPTVFVGLYAALFRSLEQDQHYRAMVAASVTYPDGQGVVNELHKRGVADAVRLATTDVVAPIAELGAARGWRVGLYGAAPGIAERAAHVLADRTGVCVAGVWDGYSGGPSAGELADARLDVLFVALGAVRQERWAYEVGAAAGVPAILTCGGLFDFLAGDKRRAPEWMQRAGMEWLFRVMLEPRRLLRRYLLGNAYFLRRAGAERHRRIVGGRHAAGRTSPWPSGEQFRTIATDLDGGLPGS